VFLVGAHWVAWPILPYEIEKHMQTMSQAEVVQVLEARANLPPGPPPDE